MCTCLSQHQSFVPQIFSGANADREIIIFPVQLTTSRVGNLTRLILLLYVWPYHTVLCVCVVIPFILDVRFVDAPAGVTQEEVFAGFLHLPSAVITLIFLARRIQLSLSLVDREVEFCVPTN